MSDVAGSAENRAAVEGMVGAREQLIFGWLVDLQDRANKRAVEIFVGGRSVGLARADRPHEVARHGGDGHYGFALYCADQPSDGAEVAAIELESATPLRWKSRPPMIHRGERSGPPLEIEGVRISNQVEVLGRVGAYPGKEIALEIWSGEQRSETTIPLSLPKLGGPFAAEVPSPLLPAFFSGDSEIALPGLKEAGLAIPLQLLLAVVSVKNEVLKIELSGKVEISGQAPLMVRLLQEETVLATLPVLFASNVASLRVPQDFRFDDGSVQLFIGDAAVPVRFHHELLRDSQFQNIGQEDSPWHYSKEANAERAYFAFPRSLAEQLGLSGHIVHVSSGSAEPPLVLKQLVQEEAARREPFVIVARSGEGTIISVRLSDQTGVLSQESTSVQNSSSWHVLKLQLGQDREVSGELVFEVEASGSCVPALDIAIGNSATNVLPVESAPANLLANPGLEVWPDGIGVRHHMGEGEIAAGWRLSNRDVPAPVLTRAILHPDDSAVGLAIAAPEVKRLRVEVDLEAAPVGSDFVLVSFRAGAPAAARQLIANQLGSNSEFMQIERISLIRRDVRDEVIGTGPKNVTFSNRVEQFAFRVAINGAGARASAFAAGSPTETYHLAFEFSRPVTIALFNVEVLRETLGAHETELPSLQLEDRNIELQIPSTVGVESWISKEAVIAHGLQQPRQAALKWSINASREPVEIIIPVFNALEETLACLDSLAGGSQVPILVRLIDDGSDKPVRDALQSFAADKPWVEVQSLGTNRGYTYAADWGIRSAQSEWVVLLNSDTVVTHGWLEGLLACARSDPKLAFVGPLSNAASFQSVPELYSAAGKWKVNSLPAGLTPNDMAEIVRSVSLQSYPKVPLLNGFCTLMRRSAFLELGGLNPTAFPSGYGEENDLCIRAGKAGFVLAVADDVYVYHVKSASFGNVRRDQLSKEGNLALRRLHPDVDINALTKSFRDCLPLLAVREGVARELAAQVVPRCVTRSAKTDLPREPKRPLRVAPEKGQEV